MTTPPFSVTPDQRWLNTSTTPPQTMKRNAGNTAWEPTRDWFQQQQDRQELRETVLKLASFIEQYSSLSLQRSQVLALAILENGECSGCVSAARLLVGTDDA